MNKKQLNALSASLSKALSPPSRKKIELSALMIDQVQPLPGIVSHPAGSEPKHHPSPPRLEKTAAIHGPISNQEAIFSERCSPLRLPSTPSHSMPSTERSDSTSPPAKTFLRQRLVRIQRVQDGLTMAEQRVLNHLWAKGEKESSATSRVLTVAQKGVAFATHLSVVSVRANLRSLESKLCIEESASFNVTEHLGRTYRVYSFASILDRWRRTGCLWARQTRGIELLKSPTPWLAGESLAPQDASQDSSVAQLSLAAQLSSTPQHSSRRSSQLKRDQLSAPLSFLSSPDHEDSSAPQLSLPPQDSSTVPKSPDFSRISGFPKESLPAQVSSAPEDSSPPQLSCTHSITCPREQESSAPQDSLPFIETENKQIKQSSTSSTVSLTEFPKTLEALAEFPASHLADDGIVCHMLSQILTNTPNASDTEIADFIRHKGKEIKNPKTSFMACLSAMVVSAMQGHRMVLYRQQRQREQEQREATRRKEFEGTVRYSEFFAAKLEQHLAGQTVDPLTLRTAIGFLQFHLPQLPKPLQERVGPALQSLSRMQPSVSVHSHPP